MIYPHTGSLLITLQCTAPFDQTNLNQVVQHHFRARWKISVSDFIGCLSYTGALVFRLIP